MARILTILCGIVILSIHAYGAAQSEPMQNALYERASQTFQHGDYAAALEQFQQLQQQLQPVTDDERARYGIVQYNVAICHFKLQHYDDAYRLFENLLGDPTLGWWATYNRGVIEQLQNRFAAAESSLWAVIINTDDDQLLDLATLQYQKLLAKQRSAIEQNTTLASSRWFGELSLAYGYDDNVVDLARLDSTQLNDNFVDILVDINWENYIEQGPAWQWNGFIYSTRFDEVDNADYVVLNSSLAKNFYANQWHWQFRVGGEHSQAGSEDYLRSTFFQLVTTINNTTQQARWKLSYQYQDINALSSEFEQLAGDVQEVVLAYERDVSERLRWSLRYNLEHENRAGIQGLISFVSLSPLRNGAAMRWLWHGQHWVNLFSLGYRNSRYRENNQLTPRVTIRRVDDRFNALLRTEYVTAANWSLFGEWNYFNNDSNLTFYSYDGSTILLGVSKSF